MKTHVADAAAKGGAITSDEQWVDVPRSHLRRHAATTWAWPSSTSPPANTTSEAERVPQPAGFAYMAPPGQESNQYGYWEHRDGRDFWVFYGQYALMRDLLFNHDYRPLDRGEWDGYRTSQRSGQTYYGRDEQAGTPRYGSQGTTTHDRYAGSSYAQQRRLPRFASTPARADRTAVRPTLRPTPAIRRRTTARSGSANPPGSRTRRRRPRSIVPPVPRHGRFGYRARRGDSGEDRRSGRERGPTRPPRGCNSRGR